MPTKIEWATEVWNPVTGCSQVSEGCQNCYAKRMAQRLKGRFGYPEDEPFRVTFHFNRLSQPHRWKNPRRIFVCSMGDLFHDDVKFIAYRDISFQLYSNKQHIFLLLTKRPERMAQIVNEVFRYYYPADWPFPNVYLGVTAENQQRWDERRFFLNIPAAKHFVSLEPLLGPMDLDLAEPQTKIDWVIVGGESGPGARPMHPDWVRSVRDQCVGAEVPFFFKQWGEWMPHTKRFGGGLFIKPDSTRTCQGDYWDGHAAAMNRVGKKQAGRLLDGREWNEMPGRGQD